MKGIRVGAASDQGKQLLLSLQKDLFTITQAVTMWPLKSLFFLTMTHQQLSRGIHLFSISLLISGIFVEMGWNQQLMVWHELETSQGKDSSYLTVFLPEVPITAGGPEIRWDLAKGAVVWGKTPGWMDGVRTTGACRATGTTASSSLQGARVSSFSKDWEMDEVELTSSKSS